MAAVSSTSSWDRNSNGLENKWQKLELKKYMSVMKKSILLGLLLLAVSVTAQAQNFALIDMEYILKNIPAYATANKQLEQASKEWQAEVDKRSQEAKSLYEKYQTEAKKLSADQMTQRENEIVEKEKEAADLRRKYFGPEGELAKKRNELMHPIQDAIYNAVKEVAMEAGYDMVIDRASAASVLFASPNIDVSDDVLDKLEKAQ